MNSQIHSNAPKYSYRHVNHEMKILLLSKKYLRIWLFCRLNCTVVIYWHSSDVNNFLMMEFCMNLINKSYNFNNTWIVSYNIRVLVSKHSNCKNNKRKHNTCSKQPHQQYITDAKTNVASIYHATIECNNHEIQLIILHHYAKILSQLIQHITV